MTWANVAPHAQTVIEVRKTTGEWVDITADVMDRSGGLSVEMAGRQTEMNRLDNGVVELTVNNPTDAYTPGNASASCSFGQGMQVRVAETIGRRRFELFRGTMSQPEALYDEDATVVVTAVDWLGGQDQGRTFVSTLAEWIIYHGGSSLVGYWPMGESGSAVKQFESAGPVQREAMILEPINTAGLATLSDDTATYEPGRGNPLPGDDLPRPKSEPQIFVGGSSGAIDGFQPRALFANPVTIGAGEYLGIAWWVTPTSTADISFALNMFGPTGQVLDLRRLTAAETPAGAWRARVKDAGITWDVTAFGPSLNVGETTLVSCTFTTSSVTLNVGGRTATGTVTGSPAATFSFNQILLFDFFGEYSHVQIYKGGPGAWTPEKHRAQWEQGINPMTGGLRWQRTDERLTTLAQYAGLPSAQLNFDRGVAYMERASLAGKTFAGAADQAVATEQGRLFVAGNGDLEFHSRLRARYNL